MKLTVFGAGLKRQYAEVGENTSVTIEQGDDLLFYGPASDVTALTKVGSDLLIQFVTSQEFTINNFFASDRVYVESIITFDDTLFTRTEIESCYSEDKLTVTVAELREVKPTVSDHLVSKNGRITGGSKIRALQDAPFVYQFTLSSEFAEDARVHVLINGKSMPRWMRLKQVSKRKFVLSGTPTDHDVGEFNLQIAIEDRGDN